MNILAIGLTSVAQFILGVIWYGGLFGKLWSGVHKNRSPKLRVNGLAV